MEQLLKITIILFFISFYSLINTKYHHDKNILKLWIFGIVLFLLGYYKDNNSLFFISHLLFWFCLFSGSIYFSDLNNIVLVLTLLIVVCLTRITNKNKEKCLLYNLYDKEKSYLKNSYFINKFTLQFKEISFLILSIILVRLVHRKK